MTPIPAPGSISRSSSFPLASQTSLLAGQCISSKLDFGAKADVVILNDGVIFASTSNLASGTYVFQDSDVGKLCFVYGVGSSDGTLNIPLAATITSIVAGNAQLSASATITGVGVMIVFGTDDTTACQAFLDAVVAVSAYGLADFQNLTYMVSALQVPSNIIITNANFIMLPGNTRLTSPLTIDGRTISPYFQTPKTNIIIRNVQINGLRHMQWGITTEAEGGGNHGLRLLGYCSDITLDRVWALNCASDGLALISYQVATTDTPAALAFQGIRVNNCKFNGNRRHGCSGDSFGDVEFKWCQFNGNGITQNFCYDVQLGDCADLGGDGANNPYATGFDFEDNTALAGGGSAHWVLRNCQMLDNYQRGIISLSHAGPFGGNGTNIDSGGDSSTPNPGFLPRNFQAYDNKINSGINQYYAGTFSTGPILSATNANPGVLTIPSSLGPYTSPATGARVTVTGFTGSWAACNGVWPATNISGDSFSIPVDTTGFGAMTGIPGFWAYWGGTLFDLAVQLQCDTGLIANLTPGNTWGTCYANIIFNGNYIQQGYVAFQQIDGVSAVGNDIQTVATAVLDQGSTYYACFSFFNYVPANIRVESNNLRNGGGVYQNFTDPTGAPTGPLNVWNVFNRAINFVPDTNQLPPTDVGIGSIVFQQNNAQKPNQFIYWDGSAWQSLMGCAHAGGIQLKPCCAGNSWIIGASWSSGIATFETSPAHLLTVGQYIAVLGVAQSGWNTTGLVITIPDSTHFTVAIVSAPATYVPGFVTSGGASNNGVQFNIYPGDATEGFLLYDPQNQAVGILTASGWQLLAASGGVTTVPHGGTGQISFPSQAILIGNGTSALGNVDPSGWPAPAPDSYGGDVYPVLTWNATTGSWGWLIAYPQDQMDNALSGLQGQIDTLTANVGSLNTALTTLRDDYNAHAHNAGTLTAAAVPVTGKTDTTDTPD